MSRPASSFAPQVGDPVSRQRIVSVLMLALLVIFAGRLMYIQGFQSTELASLALETRLTTQQISPQRADIKDRNGVVLATSVQTYHVTVNQQEIAKFKRVENKQLLAEGPADAARILAPILDMSESELAASLTGDKHFHYVAKDVSPETWALVRAERIAGISYESSSERLYPGGNIAGNILGFVGGHPEKPGNGWGLAGIESMFEETMLGTPGYMTYERGGGGTIIPTGFREEEPAVPGSSVVLTIDRDLQYLTQQRVAQAMEDTGARGIIVVVNDVETGDVLAMVDSHTVDPNNPGATPAHHRGSRAVEDMFDPGSTSKVITVAAALEEGTATPISQWIAPYEYTTANGQTFKDSHPHPDQKLTTTGILATSSNTGTIQIGQQLSEQVRHKYLQDFGFGKPTGIELPGEASGILHPYESWDGRTKYAVLYGQGVSASTLQINQVYTTLANGGVMVPPSVIAGYEAPDGTFTPREQRPGTRVVSEETADALMLMLEQVTEEGTGGEALIEGYRVAGKTGTAQMPDGQGGLTSIVASFVGVAPADDPRIVVSVIVYDPQVSTWGGTVAAPVFKDVTTFALQLLRVPPSGARDEYYPTTWE